MVYVKQILTLFQYMNNLFIFYYYLTLTNSNLNNKNNIKL